MNVVKTSFLLWIISKLYGDQARFFDIEKVPRIKHKKRGTVSMVNNGNDQHGSQVKDMHSTLELINQEKITAQ